MQTLWRLVLALLSLVACLPAAAATPAELSASCERAAEEASRRTGVPVSVLKAITLNETGRKVGTGFGPWPWTVNMEGAGHWFDTPDAARAYVYQEFKRGARSFDVGCFQVNYKWHKENFSSIDEMFDPMSNAVYAARFLAELYAESGSWTTAAGAYHSRTKEFADRYAARFATLRARFAAQDGMPLPPGGSATLPGDIPEIPDIVQAMNGPERPPRVNTYPLLQRGDAAPPPLGAAPGASLFAAALTRAGVE
ncbi:transglycosylase SLT domain-containing protein [Sinirhodobacter huangdaonensis]|uniref:transglycosylase SLT domain-containing protein n=1 Tax=Paenirhodobacter huangdaonensis TaxID=2501515 RepID=UPI001EEF8B55|nr:transglycosylase SLT domain-containing protein [Sinirhodobacter huangdaonensis]